jgi:hypothetical protein
MLIFEIIPCSIPYVEQIQYNITLKGGKKTIFLMVEMVLPDIQNDFK